MTKKPKKSAKKHFTKGLWPHTRFSKVSLAVFGLVFAAVGGYILLTSHAAGVTANVFVSPNGNDSGANCVRFATAQANPDPSGASLCASFNKAYQLASPGDTVQVEGGGYHSQLLPLTSAKAAGYHCDWVANGDIYNPVPDYSGCITFVPAPGATVTMGGLGLEVPYFRLDGGATQAFRFDRTSPFATQATGQLCGIGEPSTCTYGSAGISTEDSPRATEINCMGDTTNGHPQMQSHDIVIENIWSNDTFGLRGSHVSLRNSTFDVGDSWRPDSATSHINGCGKTGSPTIPSQYLQLDGVTVKNLLMNHLANQPGALSWQLQHMEGIHFEGGQHVVIENSAFQNIAQYDIFLETEDGTPSKDILFQNNVFDPVCSHQPNELTGDGKCGIASGGLQIDCHTGSTSLADVTARFNTFLWSPGQYGNGLGWRDEGTCAFSGTKTDYGNLFMTGAPSAWGCNNEATTVGVIPDHDMWSSGACGTNPVTGDAKISGSLSYDAHIGAGSAAIDQLPLGSGLTACPAIDFYGNARPQGAACDIGADEYVPTAGVWVSTVGNDSTCVRGDPTKPCATLDKAYHMAQPGDTVEVACGDYPAQTINYDASKADSTNYVTFVGAQTSGICWNQTDKITIGNANGSSAPSYIKLSHFSMTGGAGNFYRGASGSIVDNTVYAFYPATHITIDHQNGGSFGFSAVRDFLVENSDLGNCESEAYPNAQGVMTTDFCVSELRAVPAQTGLSNVVDPPKNSGSIIYTKFHDISGDINNKNCGSTGCHVTGMAIFGGDGVVFDHDAWWNDDVTGMRFQNFCGCSAQELKNFTIQNSWYDLSGSAFEVNSEVDGLVVRFNSMTVHPFTDQGVTKHAGVIGCDAGSMDTNGTPAGVNACGTPTNHAKIYGNIMANAGCQNNTDRSYNILVAFSVSTGQKVCDPTEKIVSVVPYASDPQTGQPDFNITGPAWAGDNFVPLNVAGGYPTTDYSGATRPLNAEALDAGAVERSLDNATIYKTGDLNRDGRVDISDLSTLLAHWGSNNAACDLNHNGVVDIADLSILLANYGK